MARLGAQLVVVSDRMMAESYYRLARQYAERKLLCDAMHCMIEAFLARSGEMHSSDQVWLDFYQRQFRRYLASKRRICCSLPEGDMIHDYLKDCYEQFMADVKNSEIPFRGDLGRFLDTRHLDFPLMEIDVESF